MGFQLEQHRAAPRRMWRIGAMQHQALAASDYHLVEPALQCQRRAQHRLFHGLQLRPAGVPRQ